MVQQPDVRKAVEAWLESCKRKGKIARNTVAVGIVVLDRLRTKSPVTREEMFSETGSELRGARSSLGSTLRKYGLPENYLKEATTRQASHDSERLLQGLDYGRTLAALKPAEREKALKEGIDVLRK